MTFGLETDKILKITKTAQYVAGKGIIIKEPKTTSSRREIVLSDGIIKLLKELKKVQIIEGLKIGKPLKDSDRIFTFHPDTISSYFVSFMRKNNLKKVSLHKLRHRKYHNTTFSRYRPKNSFCSSRSC